MIRCLRTTSARHVRPNLTGTAPDPPSGLTLPTKTSTTINSSWTPTPTTGARQTVQYSTDNFATDVHDAVTNLDETVSTYTISGLTPATLYYVRVFAHNAYGNSTYSNVASTTTDAGATQQVVGPPGSADWTYLGAVFVPDSIGDGSSETKFGYGFALKPEPSDLTSPMHFLITAFNTDNTKTIALAEFDIPTPTIRNPSDYHPSNYNHCTLKKNYARTPWKDSGGTDHFFKAGNGPNFVGFKWDDSAQRLLWTYSDTYGNRYAFGCSTLDYASATGQAVTWGLSVDVQQGKSLGGGFIAAPSGYASTYLSSNPYVIGFGGYGSKVAAGDTSMGLSLISLPSFLAASPGSMISGTKLISYSPYSSTASPSNGRMNRPASYSNINSDFCPPDSYGLSKFGWNDYISFGVWINDSKRRGVICGGSWGPDVCAYLIGSVINTIGGHWIGVVDDLKFTPASGTAPHAIQPDLIEAMQWPPIDYSTTFTHNNALGNPKYYYQAATEYDVTEIVSTAGASIGNTTACRVTCPGHPFASGNSVLITGATVTQFNGCWSITKIDANSFYIHNQTPTWHGDDDTTPGMKVRTYEGSVERIYGGEYDPTSGILYILIKKDYGINDASGGILLMMYQRTWTP